MHGRLHSSYSRYSTYENCALQYLLGQVLGLDPESTYQMAFGSLIHNLLEDLENKKLSPDLETLVAEGERRWRDEAFPAGAVTAYLRREMRRILELYLRSEYGQHETIETEKPFELDLGGWHISGRIDRIDRLENGIRLIDYKTSNSKKWPREAKEDLQLATYLLACVRNDELKELGPPKAAELVYVRHEYRGRIDRCAAGSERQRDRGRLNAMGRGGREPDQGIARGHRERGVHSEREGGLHVLQVQDPVSAMGRGRGVEGRMSEYHPAVLAALNGNPPTPEQWDAISYGRGPLSIVAGAGSGKTAVMAARSRTSCRVVGCVLLRSSA